MYDILVFLKNAYTEREATMVCQEINEIQPQSNALLLRTTADLSYLVCKEEYSSDEAQNSLAEEFLDYEQDPDKTLNENYTSFLLTREVLEEQIVKKGSYVLRAHVEAGGEEKLAEMLYEAGIPFTDIMQWLEDEFPPDYFEKIEI